MNCRCYSYLLAAFFLLQTGQCRSGGSSGGGRGGGHGGGGLGGIGSSARGVSSSRTGTYYAGGIGAYRNTYSGGGRSYVPSIGSQSR